MNIATLYYDQYKDDQAPVFRNPSTIKTIDDFDKKEKLLNMAVVDIERVSQLDAGSRNMERFLK
jgi:hypothetical protein